MRINLDSGRIARPGDRRVILEAFKPGTEPSGKQKVIGGTYTPSAKVDAGAGAATGTRAGVGTRFGARAGAATRAVDAAATKVDFSGLY